jgi:hypothetical protein
MSTRVGEPQAPGWLYRYKKAEEALAPTPAYTNAGTGDVLFTKASI